MAIKHLENLTFGIHEIDDQYREFSRAYDEFSNKIGQCMEQEALPELLEFLDNYVRRQFKYEELLILRSRYDDGGRHLDEHRQFVSEFETFKAQLSEAGPSVKLFFALKGSLIRWIISHVGRTDKDFCDYLFACKADNDQGLSGNDLGENLIDAGLISRATLETALERQHDSGKSLAEVLDQMGVAGSDEISYLLSQEGENRHTKKLGRILVESGLITQDTLDKALELQEHSEKKLGSLLVEMGVIGTEEIVEAHALQQGLLKSS